MLFGIPSYMHLYVSRSQDYHRHIFCLGHLWHSVSPKLEQYSLYSHFIAEWSDWGERNGAIMPFRNEAKGAGMIMWKMKAANEAWLPQKLVYRPALQGKRRPLINLRAMPLAWGQNFATKIAHINRNLSNLETGTQFQVPENVQRNVEIAQILNCAKHIYNTLNKCPKDIPVWGWIIHSGLSIRHTHENVHVQYIPNLECHYISLLGREHCSWHSVSYSVHHHLFGGWTEDVDECMHGWISKIRITVCLCNSTWSSKQ